MSPRMRRSSKQNSSVGRNEGVCAERRGSLRRCRIQSRKRVVRRLGSTIARKMLDPLWLAFHSSVSRGVNESEHTASKKSAEMRQPE